MSKCDCCDGKRYLIASRGDGTIAIERCDNCAWHGDTHRRTLSDQGAAKLALRDGIITVRRYPCYVVFPASFLN